MVQSQRIVETNFGSLGRFQPDVTETGWSAPHAAVKFLPELELETMRTPKLPGTHQRYVIGDDVFQSGAISH